MVHRDGGMDEAFHLFDKFEKLGKELNWVAFEKGVLQSIGYKEFYGFYRFMNDKKSEIDLKDALKVENEKEPSNL